MNEIKVNAWDFTELSKSQKLKAMSKCIVAQVKENDLSTRQALVLLEMVKAEFLDCKLS